ncbi:MAG: hypothetical protein KA715_10250 [Xanthomonadaceae bacterium]|nr:hypothetical protein [Xanthomonadaceae bacterium]
MKNILILIVLLSATKSISAQTIDYETLATTFKRAAQGEPQECPVDDHATQEFLVIFEGAGGYCPLHFQVYQSANLPEGNLYNHLTSLSSDHPSYNLRQWMVEQYNSEHERQNCNLIESLLDKQRIGSDLYGVKKILYYSKDDDALAFDCTKKIIESRAAAGVKAPVIRAMGYSMGGEAAMSYATRLKDYGHTVRAGLTIDPVGRGMRWMNSVLDKSSGSGFDAEELSHDKWLNVYQRLDTKSLKVSGIQGEWVEGAINRDLSESRTFTENKSNRKYGHIMILETEELRDTMNTWLYQF